MSVVVILGMAVGLAMDAFAVALGASCGRGGLQRGQILRLAAAFGFFQFAMPIAGWAAGSSVVHIIEKWDHWAAFGLLLLVAGRMIFESFRNKNGDNSCRTDPTRGGSLFLLSVATSIDALAVGLGIGVMGEPILFPAVVIGVVCFFFTVLGAVLGPVAGRVAGKRAELAGGLVLIAIGVKILFEHLR
jgi:manganese efflux pump family protein